MHIPAHQIHNVLKAYKKLLVVKKNHAEPPIDAAKPAFVEKRRLVIEKITQDIANRMLNADELRKTLDDANVKKTPIIENSRFAYNTITCDGGKETRFLAMESSDFLIKSVEQLAENGTDDTSSGPVTDGA